MKFHIGQRVIIWSKEGAGIFDGVTVYVKGWARHEDGSYSYHVHEYATYPGGGWMRESSLLSISEWQRKVEAGRVSGIQEAVSPAIG